MRFGSNIAACLCAACLVGSVCAAGTLNVPGGFPTIQAAIDAAAAGDTVLVADGTYMGSGNSEIDFLQKAITLRSASGPANCILDGQSSTRLVRFHRGEGPNSVLQGFTLRSGFVDPSSPGDKFGAGILCENSNPTIIECIVTGNVAAGSGAGIQCSASAPLIADCIVVGNVSENDGAGINCVNGSDATIVRCLVSGNSTMEFNGAGVRCISSDPSIIDCDIVGNAAAFKGGAIRCRLCNATVINTRIRDNASSENGGGASVYHGNLTFFNCEFANNATGRAGGALFSQGGAVRLRNCLVFGNRSDDQGGGLHLVDAQRSSIVNCTIAANQAVRAGGGVWIRYTPQRIQNCVIWDNNPDAIRDLNGLGVVAFSIVEGGWAGSGNLDADPHFISTVTEDFHPGPGSPAIDAGSSPLVPRDSRDLDGDGDTSERLPIDLGGLARILDDSGVPDSGTAGDQSAVVDIGAYEFQGVTSNCPGDLTADSRVGLADLVVLLSNFGASADETAGDLDGDADVDLGDLFILLSRFGSVCR